MIVNHKRFAEHHNIALGTILSDDEYERLFAEFADDRDAQRKQAIAAAKANPELRHARVVIKNYNLGETTLVPGDIIWCTKVEGSPCNTYRVQRTKSRTSTFATDGFCNIVEHTERIK